MSELSERLDFAVRAAIEASEVTMRYFRSPSLAVDAKPDKSPVTRADKEGRSYCASISPGSSRMTGSLVRSSECRMVPANTGGTWTPSTAHSRSFVEFPSSEP